MTDTVNSIKPPTLQLNPLDVALPFTGHNRIDVMFSVVHGQTDNADRSVLRSSWLFSLYIDKTSRSCTSHIFIHRSTP